MAASRTVLLAALLVGFLKCNALFSLSSHTLPVQLSAMGDRRLPEILPTCTDLLHDMCDEIHDANCRGSKLVCSDTNATHCRKCTAKIDPQIKQAMRCSSQTEDNFCKVPSKSTGNKCKMFLHDLCDLWLDLDGAGCESCVMKINSVSMAQMPSQCPDIILCSARAPLFCKAKACHP